MMRRHHVWSGDNCPVMWMCVEYAMSSLHDGVCISLINKDMYGRLVGLDGSYKNDNWTHDEVY